MNTAKQLGIGVCWCIKNYPHLPIAELPKDVVRVKTRFRNNAVGVAFLWFTDRVEQWVLSPFKDGKPKEGETFDNAKLLHLVIKKGVNARPAAKT